jgi:hypothetical protein
VSCWVSYLLAGVWLAVWHRVSVPWARRRTGVMPG